MRNLPALRACCRPRAGALVARLLIFIAALLGQNGALRAGLGATGLCPRQLEACTVSAPAVHDPGESCRVTLTIRDSWKNQVQFWKSLEIGRAHV